MSIFGQKKTIQSSCTRAGKLKTWDTRRTIRLLWPLLIGVLPALAEARICKFQTECFETETCGETSFAAELDQPNQQLITEFGNAAAEGPILIPGLETTLFRMEGMTFFLSVSANAARMSVHLDDGPQVITYFGSCDGI